MTIGNTKVQAADQVCNLGFFMDNTLKNQVHINILTCLAFNSDAQHKENTLQIGL